MTLSEYLDRRSYGDKPVFRLGPRGTWYNHAHRSNSGQTICVGWIHTVASGGKYGPIVVLQGRRYLPLDRRIELVPQAEIDALRKL